MQVDRNADVLRRISYYCKDIDDTKVAWLLPKNYKWDSLIY